MLETAIIVALITGACSVVGQWIIAWSNKRKADAEQAVKDKETEMRLDRLESKIDEHNGYARRFEEIAVSIAEIKTELKQRS